jgi:hypothetical protein
MALTPDDVAAIGQLLDQRLEAHKQAIAESMGAIERRATRRRRFWIWFFIITSVLSCLVTWWEAKRYISHFQDMVTSFQADTEAAKISYAQLYAHDKQVRDEAAQAAKTVHYDSSQNQGDFDANLLAQTIKLFNRSHDAAAKMKSHAGGSAADDAADLDSFTDLIDQAGNLTMQLMLHETDPAHATREERLASGELGTAPGITAPQPKVITLQPPSAAAENPAPQSR